MTIDGASIKVKGPKGELEQTIDPEIGVELNDNVLTFTRPSDHKDHRSKHGLYRALVNNMVEGVSNGYTVRLELVGVGFRASSAGQDLTLALGFSHQIVMRLPEEIKVKAETKKGENPYVELTSHDKQLKKSSKTSTMRRFARLNSKRCRRHRGKCSHCRGTVRRLAASS